MQHLFFNFLYSFQLSFATLKRFKSTLVIAEHNDGKLVPITLSAITAAKQLGSEVTLLVAGSQTGSVSN